MGLFDGILSQIGGGIDIQSIAERVGLPADQVEEAIGALGMAHAEPTDTVETAAGSAGLPTDKISEIMNHLGGEATLSKLSSLVGGQSGGSSLASGLSGLSGFLKN